MSEQVYTKDDLDGMSRVELRRIAVQVHGMDNKECSNTKSEALKDWIMEQQDGGKSNGKSAKASAAAKATKPRASKARSTKAKSKPAEEVAEVAAEVGDLGPLLERIDAVGKTLDENHTEVKEVLDAAAAAIADLDRKQFIVFGLVSDMYKINYEPDELDTRMVELEEEFAQGNE